MLMYTAATVTNFNQSVGLGNSYCNCLSLDELVLEKVPGTSAKKSIMHVIHRVKVPGTFFSSMSI